MPKYLCCLLLFICLQAHVPLNEMFGYSTGLRSMTQVRCQQQYHLQMIRLQDVRCSRVVLPCQHLLPVQYLLTYDNDVPLYCLQEARC